ncbi:hypothetical protein ABPG72_014665 [Tetrahymena utriculariae]
MKIPEAEINDLKPVPFNIYSMTDTGFQQANFSQSQVAFTEIPQLLIRINLLDLNAQNCRDINFKISLQQVSNFQFNGIIEKKYDFKITSLHISYLAISNKDIYVKNLSFQFTNQKDLDNQELIIQKQSFHYSRKNFYPWNITIIVYKAGIDKNIDQSTFSLFQQLFLSIFTNVKYLSSSFEIIFKTQDKVFNEIYFNNIEIYQSNNNYYQIQNHVENSINPPDESNIITKKFIDQKKSTTPYYKVLLNSTNGIFYGLTILQVDLSSSIRFKIQNPQIYQNSNSNYYFYEYSTWPDSYIIAVQSQFLVFSKINCSKNNASFFDDQYSCVQDCPLGYYQSVIYDPFYGNQYYCLKCSNSWQKCEKTPGNYLSCEQEKIFYNNKCPSIKPNNTFCDNNNYCEDCNYAKHPYLFQESCFTDQPERTFCDQSQNIFNCISCKYESQFCDEKMQCLSCTKDFLYLYENQCYHIQPESTFYEANQNKFYCVSCPQQCQSCDQQMICLTCTFMIFHFSIKINAMRLNLKEHFTIKIKYAMIATKTVQLAKGQQIKTV